MRLPAINLPQNALSRFDESIQKEWIITNGLGGYAASTVLGINTRKYHGLLVAALQPPGNRTVCLAKLDEDARVGNNVYQLGTNEFHRSIFPQGYQFLKEFSMAHFPKYVYTVQNVEVAKSIFMPIGKNAVAVVYSVLNGNDSDVKFRIYPMLTCRHFHSVIDRTRRPLYFTQKQKGCTVELTFDSQKATISARATDGEFINKPNWIESLFYREEDKRGESSTDNCYQPGYFEIQASPKKEKTFSIITAAGNSDRESKATLDAIGNSTTDIQCLLELDLKQRSEALAKFYVSHKKAMESNWLSRILSAAATFIVNGPGNRKSVIAGYFWFETWGRDTFVSLPGLMLTTGRYNDARKVLLDFLSNIKHGLIPNCIADENRQPAYNTVDASLWYVNAVLQYLKYTGNFNFVQERLWVTLKTIVDLHKEGTAFDIRVDIDGLLAHGPQLTWMDAQVADLVVTPRPGKAVEIQALWYNTLKTMQLLAERFEEKSLAEKYAEMAAKARVSFIQKFWNSKKHCLFDVVGASADASLRPNQIIAAALDFIMIDKSQSRQVVDTVQRELLTPFGLRTLSCADQRYKGIYAGDRPRRDQAYHNGTVWAWLFGPYVTALCRASPDKKYELKKILKSFFIQQISQAGLGTVSEVFDGDPPHTPRGCIAQAWSVAEPLRAYIEDVLQIRPKFEQEVMQT